MNTGKNLDEILNELQNKIKNNDINKYNEIITELTNNKLNDDYSKNILDFVTYSREKYMIDSVTENVKNNCNTYSDNKNKCLLRNVLDPVNTDKCVFIESSFNNKGYCSNYDDSETNKYAPCDGLDGSDLDKCKLGISKFDKL
jgi:hypothetical protein